MEQENSSGVLESCVNPKMEEDWLDADSGDDEELSSDEEDRDEDKNSVKDDHFSDVSGLMKQEMVEKDEVPFLNVPAPEGLVVTNVTTVHGLNMDCKFIKRSINEILDTSVWTVKRYFLG